MIRTIVRHFNFVLCPVIFTQFFLLDYKILLILNHNLSACHTFSHARTPRDHPSVETLLNLSFTFYRRLNPSRRLILNRPTLFLSYYIFLFFLSPFLLPSYKASADLVYLAAHELHIKISCRMCIICVWNNLWQQMLIRFHLFLSYTLRLLSHLRTVCISNVAMRSWHVNCVIL